MYKKCVFTNPDRGKQLLLFDGLNYDSNVAPMDLDGLIEYHNKKRVLLELKLKNTPVPYGERIALERMVNDFGDVGKESIAVVADHTVFNESEDVIVGDAIVREIYWSKDRKWRPPKRMMTVKMLVDKFLE